MNFDKEAKSNKKKVVGVGGGALGLPGTETKTVCQTVSNEVNTTRIPRNAVSRLPALFHKIEAKNLML